jgi:glutathione S-transferase
MKLYTAPGTCALACHIALYESGAPFEAVRVNLRDKTTATGDDYRKINPKGSVPALEIEAGQVLTEGVAIMQYAVDSVGGAGVAPAVGTLERARMQEAMNFISGELHKTGYGPLFRPGITQEQKDAQFAVIDTKLGWLEGLMADGRDTLVTGGHTLADSYLTCRGSRRSSHCVSVLENGQRFRQRSGPRACDQ